MEKAVNLCDIGLRLLKNGRLAAAVQGCDRVYIGSYFCDRYFLAGVQPLLKALKSANKPVTLVLPIPSQTNLEKLAAMTQTLLKKHRCICAVVVNDPGMLTRLQGQRGIRIILGRLFSKALRDPRFPETLESYTVPRECEALIETFGCAGIEVEGCFGTIGKATADAAYELYVHAPPYYMSCMRTCFFAAISKPAHKKFRPDAPCALECSHYRLRNVLKGDHPIDRMGKGVYFTAEAPVSHPCAVRIETPVDMW